MQKLSWTMKMRIPSTYSRKGVMEFLDKIIFLAVLPPNQIYCYLYSNSTSEVHLTLNSIIVSRPFQVWINLDYKSCTILLYL